MIRNVVYLFMLALAVCALTSAPAMAVQEREPNDTPEQATPMGGDKAATGTVHRNDQDWYRLSLPAPSTITARVSSSAGDCQMQVTGAVSKGGSTTGLGSGTGSVTFNAPAGDVYIRVNVANVAVGICSGSEWCGIQCNRQGPVYVTPEKDGRPPQKVPGTHDGKPVLPPITYQLTLSSSATPSSPQTGTPGTPPPPSTPPRPTQPPVAPPPVTPPHPEPPKPSVPPPPPAGAGVQEREPNDTAEQATPLGGALSATGLIHMNDQDWYRLSLPAPGTVTARASASAGECQLQVAGFAGRTGSLTSLGGANGSVTFNAPAGDVYVRVAVANVAAGVCSGSDWCAIQCTRQGPWYVTPFKDGRQVQRVPATNDGKPVLPPLTYQLAISSTSTPTTTPTRPDQPPQPPITQPPQDQPKPQGELVQNPGMRGQAAWTVVEWYKPSSGKGEVSFEADGIRFRSQAGNTRIGVLQEINRDVSGCGSLVLSATIRADQQTLTGTGYNGREAPIAIFMKYTDMSGVVHELLSENPSEPRNMFWNGFYYLDPTPPSISAHGSKIPRGAWQSLNVDLLRSIPKPRTIHFIGAEGAGWPVRDGKIGGLSLQCR
jgi:hypothetical protein